MLTFEISGLPVPWAPSRLSRNKHAFNPKYKEKECARWQIKAQHNATEPYAGAVHLDLTFHMPIPSGTSKIRRSQMLAGMIRPIKRPDTTNLQKFIEDCLTGIVFEDDSQVIEIHSRKIFGEIPKTVVRVALLQSGTMADKTLSIHGLP